MKRVARVRPPVMDDRSGDRGDAAERPLDVQLAVEVSCGCPLRNREVEAVRQSLTRSEGDEPERCQVAVPAGNGYEQTAVDGACPCAILAEHECVADLAAVRDGRLLYDVVVPRREVLRSIVAALRDAGATVSVERIRTGSAREDPPAADVSLTPKQREALALAIETGYYDRPRGATLEELADELDVTPSAVSQRLTAVERKLVAERAREFDLARSGAAD